MTEDKLIDAIDRVVAAILVLAVMVSIDKEESLGAGVDRVAEAWKGMKDNIVR